MLCEVCVMCVHFVSNDAYEVHVVFIYFMNNETLFVTINYLNH